MDTVVLKANLQGKDLSNFKYVLEVTRGEWESLNLGKVSLVSNVVYYDDYNKLVYGANKVCLALAEIDLKQPTGYYKVFEEGVDSFILEEDKDVKFPDIQKVIHASDGNVVMFRGNIEGIITELKRGMKEKNSEYSLDSDFLFPIFKYVDKDSVLDIEYNVCPPQGNTDKGRELLYLCCSGRMMILAPCFAE